MHCNCVPDIFIWKMVCILSLSSTTAKCDTPPSSNLVVNTARWWGLQLYRLWMSFKRLFTFFLCLYHVNTTIILSPSYLIKSQYNAFFYNNGASWEEKRDRLIRSLIYKIIRSRANMYVSSIWQVHNNITGTCFNNLSIKYEENNFIQISCSWWTHNIPDSTQYQKLHYIDNVHLNFEIFQES